MTKSELKELIRETILTEMEGYSKYYDGKTPGLTTDVINTILMNIAKSAEKIDSEEEDKDSNTED